MDKIKFEAGFRAIALAVGHKFENGEDIAKLRLYYNTLKENGYTDEMWETAVNRMIQTFKPQYGNTYPILKAFLDIGGMSVSERAKRAHKYTYSQIKDMGYTCPPEFKNCHSHNVAKECIRSFGGWYAICQNGLHEWDKTLSKYIETFEKLYFKEPSQQPLLGHSDLRNQEFLAKYNKNQIGNNNE